MTTNWRQYRRGIPWAVLDDGRIVVHEKPDHEAREAGVDWSGQAGGGYVYRTRGAPRSMRQLFRDYGLEIREAAEAFDLPLELIPALIAIEADRLAGDRLRFDPRSIRTEPGYRSDRTTPDRVSPGLMQTLLATAGDMVSRCPWLEESRSTLDREDLFVPRYSISLGGAYVRWQMDRMEDDEEMYGLPPDDPIANAVAAYNAGSVRYTKHNRWHLVAYSPTRIGRFISWWNDAHEVLRAPAPG